MLSLFLSLPSFFRSHSSTIFTLLYGPSFHSFSCVQLVDTPCLVSLFIPFTLFLPRSFSVIGGFGAPLQLIWVYVLLLSILLGRRQGERRVHPTEGASKGGRLLFLSKLLPKRFSLEPSVSSLSAIEGTLEDIFLSLLADISLTDLFGRDR